MQRDLTIEDVLNDPLIALLRRADRISTPEFTQLLSAASQTYLSGKTAKPRAAPHGARMAQPLHTNEFEADVSLRRATPKASETCLGW
ncbi:hypothetical protein [Neorhizobium sp. NCHU2750]|uniref:hypothetical protein n=1 Tax=Neorhizobium sp. NCHU2750 TaxID=1825976 RepID=UPI000E70B4BF|nr:hypothetical protein NCHU2750_09570 [Neorhizobium sp. NCHU2750]